jgi:hypothetical protein
MARLKRGIVNTGYPPNVQEKLAAIAARKGVMVDEYLRTLLAPNEPASLADALPPECKNDPELWALIQDDPVTQLLLAGRAATAEEAERMFLRENAGYVSEAVLKLTESGLSPEEFNRHPLILLVRGHGSRRWEDSLV